MKLLLSPKLYFLFIETVDIVCFYNLILIEIFDYKFFAKNQNWTESEKLFGESTALFAK